MIDRATYEDAGQLSEGIRHVLVNGRVALRDGRVTGEQGGRVLTRSPHMPSRPMTTTVARQVTVVGGTLMTTSSGEMRIWLDLMQASRAPQARGSFSLVDSSSQTKLESTALGVLQTAKDWASFTARVRSSGPERSALVIVEQKDPFVEGNPATVTIAIDGANPISGRLSPTAVDIRTAATAAPARHRE